METFNMIQLFKMKSSEFEQQYIAISGDIGVGKSTAGRYIAKGLEYKFYPEPAYWRNPHFLQEGKAFQAETHFLMRSIEILLKAREQRMVTGVVVDVPPEQHANDYPQILLAGKERTLFLNMYKILKENYGDTLMEPSLIVYLEAQPDVILDRIHKRRRPFEQNITTEDIERHTELNHDWIARSHLPVLFIQTDNLDFIHSSRTREQLVTMVRDKLNSHE